MGFTRSGKSGVRIVDLRVRVHAALSAEDVADACRRGTGDSDDPMFAHCNVEVVNDVVESYEEDSK
jgi:hypothetical protein